MIRLPTPSIGRQKYGLFVYGIPMSAQPLLSTLRGSIRTIAIGLPCRSVAHTIQPALALMTWSTESSRGMAQRAGFAFGLRPTSTEQAPRGGLSVPLAY